MRGLSILQRETSLQIHQQIMRFIPLLAILMAVLAACSSSPSNNINFRFVVTTLVDANNEPITFARPEGLAIDKDGNLFVAEAIGGIRRVSPEGVVSTIIQDDEVALPSKLAFDSEGNLYITESGRNRIIRVDQSGRITVVAGTGEMGLDDGDAEQAQFFLPLGIAVDESGTIYVADSGNNRIRWVSPQGEVGTLVDSEGAESGFIGISGITLASSDILYVADADGKRIHAITPEGAVSTFAGNGEIGFSNGPALEARFNGPSDIAIDSQGNFYIADLGNHSIRIITPDGHVNTAAGNGESGYGDGEGADAQFMYPQAVAIDANDTIYVADSGNNVIRVMRRVSDE
ncbi:MAG: hypothetical protein D6737_02095 [Chloroflexi bacterium]|nr:MAG: hypothetical protein D6737_02095 [Chloroflexota bacterium]